MCFAQQHSEGEGCIASQGEALACSKVALTRSSSTSAHTRFGKSDYFMHRSKMLLELKTQAEK
jgi:hypothetical protein